MQIPDPMTTPDATASYNEGGDGHNHGGDGHTHGEPLPDIGSNPLASGGRVFKVDGTTQVITNFNITRDKVDLGLDSIHNQIPIDTVNGLVFQNYHNLDKSLTLVGVSLKDLKPENFTPIADAHLQQDLSAALAWEDGSGLVRPNTVYVRSHESNLQEEVDFDPATDKISFFYLSVRGDSQQNFSVEETAKGVRFYSPVTGQSITLKGIKFSDLNSSHFEWRANQLEDNIAQRMGLSDKIADFRIVESNVFNGKSVAMAGGVDRSPYHSFNYSEYTGTPIGSNPDPVDPVDPVDPIKSTIAEIVAQSGGEFDGNNQDFDILLQALQAGGLVDAVADPAADLTVFAPTDAAFIKLAQDLGYQGSDETGAYNAIVEALTDLGNGDPIPVLQNVLKYHVSPGVKTLNEIKGANSVSTLLDGATMTPNGNTLGDKEPDFADPKFVNNLTNVEASNGIVQGIDRVLIPLDIPGNSSTSVDPVDPTPTNNSEVDFSITNNWGSGYQGQVEITNRDSSQLDSWTLEFEFSGNISQIWNAEIVSKTGNTYVISNASYNGTVAPDQRVTFGFIGEGSTSNLPDIFTLNGKVVGDMPSKPTEPDPIKSTIAEIVAQSGGEFDSNNQDFDILLQALQAGGLVDAVGDPAADLTVFAPTDAAFIKLAQDLGYQGSDETGAYDAIVGTLTDLGNGDPIPVLQNILKYHVSAGAKTLNEVKAANSISTLLDGANITPNGNSLIDNEPDLNNPSFVSGLTNVEASNGIVQGIDRVLIPLDIPGNSTPTEPTDPTTPTEPTMPGGHNHGGHNHNGDHPGAFNYAEAIQKSFLFYEANRSGKLPADNRIPWRGDSALNDGADVGRDLTGGYYDAGDHVKFGFPMAASMTMLAWGGEQYSDAYDKIGQKDELLDAVKWGTDYILKAYDDKGTADVSDDVFYGQVGNGQADHSFWGPPEIMTMNRPTYQIDAQNPGSDLAGESAAALASASIIFRPSNQAYADQLLTQAQKLYEFAETYQGKYSDSITDARNFYNSWSGYTDELAWGATWLHKATEAAGQTDTQYLAKAEQYYQETNGIQYAPFTQNWDDKKYGTAVLLAQETGDTQYQVQVEAWLDRWMIDRSQGGIPKYTEGGLAWLDQWGANRYSANTAMLAGIYSDTVNDKGGIYNDFVHSQIKYMLGDNPNNISYVIGFGDNYPQNPHHRGAHGSLNNNINDGETKHILYGALVGGPSQPDDSAYNDRRDDYISNEVTTDYNAGFTGALAYLANRHSDMPLPDSAISNLFGSDTTPPGSPLSANPFAPELNDQNMDMFAQPNTFELTPPSNY